MRFIIAVFFLIMVSSTDGISQLRFGAGANFTFDNSLLGVGGRMMYDINEDFAAQGQFSLFLDDVADFIIELDVYYKGLDLGDVEGFQLTPFAGLNIFRASVLGFGASDTGLTLGLQGLSPLTDSMDLYVEPKIYLGGGSSFAIAAGVYF